MPSSDHHPPPPPVPENPVLLRTESQWIFTPSELLRAPSILDGLNPTTEQAQRAKGVNFITQVGVLLKLPQLTTYLASVYLNRFFMRYSMVDLPNRPGMHYYAVAATATFLATKVEENCRKMKELVVACARVAQKNPSLLLDEQSKEYWRWRDTILHNEDLLLEGLCFDLQITSPHRLLFDFLCHFGAQDHKKMRNASWAFVNDSALTTLCLEFTTRTIAAAGLYLAARHTDFAFPDDEYGRPWWEQLDVDVVAVQKACHRMADIYEYNPFPNPLPRTSEKGLFSITDGDGDAEAAATRLATSSIPNNTNYSPAVSVSAESQGVKRDRDDGEEGEVEESKTSQYDSFLSQAENGGSTSRPPSTVNDSSTKPSSPKRQRLDLPHHQQQAQNGRPHDPLDDVQSRIDAIVNGASDQQSANQGSQYHPSLSRRPSQQSHQQPRPPPPPRRRSSSSRSRDRYSQSHHPPRPPSASDRRDSYDRARERRGSYERERRGSYDRGRGRDGERRRSYDRGRDRWDSYERSESYERRRRSTSSSTQRRSRDDMPSGMDGRDRGWTGDGADDREGSGSEEGEL